MTPTTDGNGPDSTHIYCKPLQISECQNNKTKLLKGKCDKSDKTMISSVKMPSNVMPVDVGGQTLSRMASLRRSLIHVDFLLRKKKKEKRRNTVAEGDSSEIKNALQNMINEEHQKSVPNGTLVKLPITSSIHTSEMDNSFLKKVTGHNLNSDIHQPKDTNSLELSTRHHSNRNSDPHSQSDSQKVDLKNSINGEISDICRASFNKKKPKSNLPISTISAAMNVAVEMRLKTVQDRSASRNSNSVPLNPDPKARSDGSPAKSDPPLVNGEDSGFSDSYKDRKNKSKATSFSESSQDETEAASSTSSEATAGQDEDESNATSAGSDGFFFDSDDSDEDSADFLKQTYGSSTSISTVSGGSLNSLLSQTGTEMTSSTGTLTSLGFERYPTPPPPPPPFVTVAPKIQDTNQKKITFKGDQKPIHPVMPILAKHSSKPGTSSIANKKSSEKTKKSSITDGKNKHKNSDGAKGIFINVGKKQQEGKNKPTKYVKNSNNPLFFDVYGNSSPQKNAQLSVFIHENTQPMVDNQPRTRLQSFLPIRPESEIDLKTEQAYCSNQEHLYPIRDSPPSETFASFAQIPPIKNIEVPIKYVQQVVVTPISRQNVEKNDSMSNCRKSLFNDGDVYQANNAEILAKRNSIQVTDKNVEGPILTSNPNKPLRPNTLQTTNRSAARVVLDPEGRVIYSTNSLDRRPLYESPNQNRPIRYEPNDKYASTSSFKPIGISVPYSSYHPPQNSNSQLHQNSPYIYNNPSHCTQKGTKKTFDHTNAYGGRSDEFYNVDSISRKQTNRQTSNQINNSHANAMNSLSRMYEASPDEMDFPAPPPPLAHAKMTLPRYDEADFDDSPHIVIADPNISGLPPLETMLTEKNINLHLQNMERLNRIQIAPIVDKYMDLMNQATPTPPPVIEPPPANVSKIAKGSPMSAQELFSVIHDCKKRLNIKTDSDISSSSRSASPSYLRTPPQKGICVETGFLSPRNPSATLDYKDRRSWPGNGTPNERKSLASDRLGKTKPTSMHDFKMLLLQTRSHTQSSGPRKSAVEMLKISPKTPTSSGSSSPQYSSPSQNSPMPPSYVSHGHSTVPFKRHSSRVRGHLHSRYTMYPPIFEEYSEGT